MNKIGYFLFAILFTINLAYGSDKCSQEPAKNIDWADCDKSSSNLFSIDLSNSKLKNINFNLFISGATQSRGKRNADGRGKLQEAAFLGKNLLKMLKNNNLNR